MSHEVHLENESDDALVTKLVATATGVAASLVANVVIREVWKTVTGKNAPKNANDPSLRVVQAVAFAALSAGVAVLARRLATHGAQGLVHKLGRHSTAELADQVVAQALKNR